jgi:hypothetical protein
MITEYPFLASGPLYEVPLDPEMPSYIDTRCLVAFFPKQSTLRLAVYGNSYTTHFTL